MSRRKSSDEVAAEYVAMIVFAIATVGLVMIGAMIAGVFQGVTRVYAEHGKSGQPAAIRLRRAWQLLLAAWGVACLLAVAHAAALGALLGVGATVIYVMVVLVMGKWLDQAGRQPLAGAGELDTYLAPFADRLETPPPSLSAASPAGTPHLRVIRTPPRSNGAATPDRNGR